MTLTERAFGPAGTTTPALTPGGEDARAAPSHTGGSRADSGDDGTPTDALHVHGYATPAETSALKEQIWGHLDVAGEVPAGLGDAGQVSEPLALTRLLLLYHAMAAQAVPV